MHKELSTVAVACMLQGSVGAQSATGIPEPTPDWGCEVLLCLANPDGPMAVAPCVPPITRLWRELARGRGFPGCAMASGPNGRSYATPAWRYFDPCPAGTVALAPGMVAWLAAPMAAANPASGSSGSRGTYVAGSTSIGYLGIGDGNEQGIVTTDGAPAPKVCVAGLQGTRLMRNGDDHLAVQVYTVVYVAPAPASARVIDVYVDDRLWHSVRW